jgi:hypothetical protein
MGWFAGGDPAELVSPTDWERIRSLMGPLDYAGTVFGVSGPPGESMMPDIARRYSRALALHRYDEIVDVEPEQSEPGEPTPVWARP